MRRKIMFEIDVLTPDSATGRARELLQETRSAFGFVPNLMGTMANAPALAEGYRALSGLFEQTSFSATERQVVLLSASRVNGCHYCMAAHSAVALKQQVAQDVVAAIRDDVPIADGKLETLRRLTVAIVETRGWPDEEVISAFLGAGYQPSQVLEVVLGVGMKTLSNYTNHIAHVQLDPQFAAQKWTPPG